MQRVFSQGGRVLAAVLITATLATAAYPSNVWRPRKGHSPLFDRFIVWLYDVLDAPKP